MINPKTGKNTAVVILAAGSSSRLGKPKQLLYYQLETLIKRVVKTAIEISDNKVFVVTGFLHHELISELKGLPVHFVQNSNWAEGMGSSIRTGISAILESENANQTDAALFLLSDQPLINSSYLKILLSEFYLHKNSMIAITGYSGTQGVPAVFDKSFFLNLQQLSGKGGAKEIFKNYQNQLITVPFEDAKIDIDTEEDYTKLLKLTKNKH
ncbi:MAG: nucleotidyltransferase family protein [Janthinobacterium lividum]